MYTIEKYFVLLIRYGLLAHLSGFDEKGGLERRAKSYRLENNLFIIAGAIIEGKKK